MFCLCFSVGVGCCSLFVVCWCVLVSFAVYGSLCVVVCALCLGIPCFVVVACGVLWVVGFVPCPLIVYVRAVVGGSILCLCYVLLLVCRLMLVVLFWSLLIVEC